MFKLPQYIILLIGVIVIPVLSKICISLKERAAQTPETWDDILVGAFETVLEFLKNPGVFESKSPTPVRGP